MGCDDGWLAYQVDVTTLLLGRRIEEMTAPGRDGRPQMSVEAALGMLEPGQGAQPAAPGRFRNPAPYVTEVRRIPESGVW